jgi:hypothetical protein
MTASTIKMEMITITSKADHVAWVTRAEHLVDTEHRIEHRNGTTMLNALTTRAVYRAADAKYHRAG